MMKTLTNKFILFFAIAMMIMSGTMQSKAQNGAIGIRFMPTFSQLEMKTSTGGTVEGEVTLGYGFGIFLGYFWSDYVGIQGELMYTSTSQKYSEADVERRLNLKYLNVPLLLSLNTGKSKLVNFNVVVGPQIGFNVGAKVISTGPDTTSMAVVSVKAGALGFAYGAGLDFGVNEARRFRVGIGYRGVLGLFDISDNSQSSTTNSFYIIDRANLKTHAGYIGISYLF
jgi:hypothetical protein